MSLVHRTALVSVLVALNQIPAYAVRPCICSSASCGVTVYTPSFAGTKLYCLVTEAHSCEELAQGCYLTVQWPGIEFMTTESRVQCFSH